MPSPGFTKHARDPSHCARDLERFRARHPERFPQFERPNDLSRGELRLLGEIMLSPPEDIPAAIQARAMMTLNQLARG